MDTIQYTTTGDYNRNRVVRYHGSPSPKHLGMGAKKGDIATLKSAQKRNVIEFENGNVNSRFTIGFEVEKSRFSRGAVTEYALFAGFERDGSCGYEAITHILPLLPKGEWRNKVFNMMYEAKRIIEDSHSPSDHRCGGHITLAVDGMEGEELMNRLKKFSGVMLSLFRRRLGNGYCRSNPFMDVETNAGRYQVCLRKGDRVEFRLPSRITGVKQMMRRYELCYMMLDFAVNRPNASFKTFLKAVTPIVSSMYGHDEVKVTEILTLSEAFNKMLRTGQINRETIAWIDPHRNMTDRWDRDLTRHGW
tara:strand:- start:704 stop:1618 length:915 start_codon:yes stop_codon:yes gene_type:complete